MNTKIIKFDLNKKLYEKIIAKQGDTKSRFLLFNLLDGAVPFNLTNRSVRVYGLKKDGTEIFNDLIINNAAKGYCTLELTNQMLALPGEVELELMIIEGDKKLTSNIFTLEVRKSINSEKAIVSTNEFTALLNGLASLNEYDNYKNEIKEARGGQTKLKDRLDNFDSHLEQKANEIDVYLKKYGININDFDEQTRKTFLENNNVNVNYVLGVENVKPINTTFVNIKSNNLYNPKNYDYNGYYQNGVYKSDLLDYGSSGFIELEVVKDSDFFYNENGGIISLFDINKSFIKEATTGGGYFKVTADTKFINIAIPKSNIYKFYVIKNGNKLIENMSINENIKVNETNINYSENSAKVLNYVNEKMINKFSQEDMSFINLYKTNLYNPLNFIPNKFYIDSTISSYSNYGMTGFIPVKPNTTYQVLDKNVVVGYTTAWTLNKEYIKNLTPSKTIVVPDNCYFINIAIQDIYKNSFVIVESGNIDESYYILNNVKINNEDIIGIAQKLRFKGKKANFIGDSITYGYGNVTPYHQYLKDMNGLSVVRNYGISGSRIATTSDRSDEISKRYINMDNDADLICVYAGINDFYGSVPIGTNTDNTTNTFKGALNVLFNGLIEKYQSGIIFAVTPMKVKNLWNGGGIHLSEYRKAIIEIADIFSIPVLDLYSCSNISVKNETQLNHYTQDGLHPNDLGHKERLAPKFSSFIESL